MTLQGLASNLSMYTALTAQVLIQGKKLGNVCRPQTRCFLSPIYEYFQIKKSLGSSEVWKKSYRNFLGAP